MKRLVKYFDEYFSGSMISTDDVGKWILQLVELNQHLPVCKEIMALDDEQSQLIFALALSDFADFGGTDSEGVSIAQLCNLFGEDDTYFQTECLMKNGEHELFGRGLLEFRCADGMIDSDSYVLTDRVRNDLIDGFVPAKVKFTGDKSRQQGLVKFGEITSKLLFLNKKEQTQIDQLKTVISQEGFAKIQERLSECGLRKGIACLFYGGPGTGKTETALQIARQTGRNILKVDISEIRDKWVGESEKNIRGIFKNYRQMCQESDSIPILLFNEADAVINRRIESPFHSVDKMDNAIQNIILEELENLEGIVIATTNLTGAIDDAFDRRFLFKVEFAKPDVEAKASIWESMLKYLNLQDCKLLAKEFDFSGGQIENIARKCKIDYVIKGQLPDIAQVREYCRQEALNRVTTAKVGFCR